MRIIETTFEKLPTKFLLIGFEGENLRATVRIDCASVFAEYPNATPALIVKPLFADAYPVVVDRNGTDVDWLITSEILSFNGDGEIQLVFYKDAVICKSAVSKIRVSRSLQATGEKPDPIARWEDAANQKLAEVDAALVSIDEMDATAHGLPEGSAPTAEVQTVDDHKRIVLGIPAGATGATGAKGDKGDRGEVGATPQIGIGNVQTLPAGSEATASMSGTTENPLLNLGIPQGIQGVKGDRGEKGDTGATGATGATPDFSIGTVSTLPAGSSATAEITGTAENPVLSLGIPQGAQGIQGEKGEKGDPGDGVPTGGLKDQVLAKASDTDRDTKWMYVAPVIKNTASGAIASFPDGADGHPIDELKVSIEPVQDLHGYDHPWPAGGGKNLFDINSIVVGNTSNWSVDVNGDTLTVTHKTSYTSGTPTFVFNQPSGTYVISIGSINITGQVSLYVNGSWTKTINNGDTFTIDAANTNEIKFSAQENQSTIITKIQIESGNTATSYAPYSNICPITGWTAAQVWDDPVHGGNVEWNQGANLNIVRQGATGGLTYVLTGNGRVKLTGQVGDIANIPLGTACEIKEGHKYYSRFGDFVSVSNGDVLQINGWEYVILFGNIFTANKNMRAGLPLTLRSDNKTRVYDGSELSVQIFDLTQMFGAGNEPATVEEFRFLFPADYYPYNTGEITTVSAVNGNPYRHYSITLPTEAGTVYGGTLDVSTGELVVDRVSAQLTGTAVSASWDSADANRDSIGFYTNAANWESNTGLPKPVDGGGVFDYCYVDTVYASDNWWAARFLFTNGSFNRFEMRIPKNVLSTPNTSGAKAYLNDHPLQAVYKIAPQTYTLTPTEIRTLLGENNVWSDAGDVSVKYNADTKLYIDNKITQAIAAALNS